MADKTSSSSELKFETLFVDGDTRTFSIKNPKDNLTRDQIAELNTYMQQTGILIGDKYGGRFGKITKATNVLKDTTTLDLNED